MTIASRILDFGIALLMEISARPAYTALLRSAADPSAAQWHTLQRIIASTAPTAFGRSLGLGGIDTIEAFRQRVPIHDYEPLRPWVERQIAGEVGAIVPTPPLMYARTSGTTGAAKLIPVTAEVLVGLRRAQRVMAYVQHSAARAFSGGLLAIGGSLREVTLADGTPAGATTALIAHSMPLLLRSRYVVPAEVLAIADAELKYLAILRLALQDRSLCTIATANPSTILRLMEVLNGHATMLIAGLADGTFAPLSRLPADAQAALLPRLRATVKQAAALSAVLKTGRPLRLADAWPTLRAVVTWTGGSCAPAAEAVAKQLPPGTRLIDAGYVASEMRGTVTIDAESGLGLPLLDDVFYEFIPVDAWDAGLRDTLLIGELSIGQDYQVLVTTAAGLVRYAMNDVLRVTGQIGATPTLGFVRKGRGVTSITGEKLAENQVTEAILHLARQFGREVPFYIVVADDVVRGYVAHLQITGGQVDADALARCLEDRLGQSNIEYASKRASGRLKPLAVNLLSAEAGSAYRRHLVGKGQRETQLKVPTLQRRQDCDFDFEPYHAHA